MDRPTHIRVIPVLFMALLATSLPRAILPEMMQATFGDSAYSYAALGEGFKGILAFLFTPMVLSLAESRGRKVVLTACLIGTAAPMSVLMFTGTFGELAILR
jgi:hypothetical protein